MRTLTLDQLENLSNTVSLLSTVQALLIPINDFSCVNRDELAQLFKHFINSVQEESDPDKQYSLQVCLGALTDLLNPDTNQNATTRDNFAALLAYLVERLENALKGAV